MVLESLTDRRFLLTSWPWRAVGYNITTLLVAAGAGAVLTVLGLPWAAMLFVVTADSALSPSESVLLGAFAVTLLIAFGPLVALPVAELERDRLRVVQASPVVSGHQEPAAPGVWPWLRTRYTEAATWRELAHLLLLISVVPIGAAAGLCVLMLASLQIGSPIILLAVDGPVALGLGEVRTAAQALWRVPLGLLLVPIGLYLAAGVSGVHAAAVRPLVQGTTDDRLRAELAEVAQSRVRLVDAFDSERRRIERDLHDGAQQRLLNLTMQLGLARLDVPPGSPAGQSVANAHEQAKLFTAELREFIHGIHPKVLTDRGLPAAINELADRSTIRVKVTSDLPERLAGHVEGTAYFVIAEALTNAVKHGVATEARIDLRRFSRSVVAEIHDNGQGGADPRKGSGLSGMADRVAGIDGTMSLCSPPGGPTVLRVELPCDSRNLAG